MEGKPVIYPKLKTFPLKKTLREYNKIKPGRTICRAESVLPLRKYRQLSNSTGKTTQLGSRQTHEQREKK